MSDQLDPYNFDDLLNHPQCLNDANFNLDTAILQLEAIDAAEQCDDTITSRNRQRGASYQFFCNLVGLWEAIAALWQAFKNFHKQIKQRKVIDICFTEWLPNFLYSNNVLDVVVTDGNEYNYKQIRRYVTLPFDRVREYWELEDTKGLLLPCDTLVGPFISNNRQLFSAGQLYKMMKKEQSEWDDSLSILDNCRSLRHLIYYYSDMLPFQTVTFNKYDRKVFFQENPSESGRRNDLVARDNKKKANYLLNRKEIRMQSVINNLGVKVEKQKQEIDRKESVLQFTLIHYNDLKQRYAELQQQCYILQHQNNMQYNMANGFDYNQNNIIYNQFN